MTRGKAVAFAMTIWIRLVTWCRATHCSIGDGNIVVDNRFGGSVSTRFWPFHGYIEHYPGLICYFEVPTTSNPQLAEMEGLGPKRAWDIARWYVSRGRYPCSTSCVAIVIGRLRKGGVAVPDLYSPSALYRWLEKHEYHREALE